MKCTYTLTIKDSKNGDSEVIFETDANGSSELKLDNWLAEHKSKLLYDSKFTDVVFDAESKTQADMLTVIKEIEQDNLNHRKADSELRMQYGDDEVYEKYERPYIGVNEFLSEFITNDNEGKHLFP